MDADLPPQIERLPHGFQFSQGSLQDLVDCRRRFQLRYIQGVAWPALQTEPAMQNERAMQQGARFHRMIHQHLLGVEASRLASLARDDDLARWWENYLNHKADLLSSAVRLYPEITLSAPLGEYRLLAKYDLLAVASGGRLTIIDWKTSSRKPRRAWLAERLQTRVYPYLLVRAGAHLSGGQALQAEQVEMLYWYANSPDQPERFVYNQSLHRENQEYLSAAMDEVERRTKAADFPLTSDEKHCAYCVYRSLCDRGERAGSVDELDEAPELEESRTALDFEHIPEIEF